MANLRFFIIFLYFLLFFFVFQVTGNMSKVKTVELRGKKKEDLSQLLDDQKQELANILVSCFLFYFLSLDSKVTFKELFSLFLLC